MLIKEAKYKNVMVKSRKIISEAVYGCDECKTEIKEYPNEEFRLDMSVFKKDDSRTDNLHFYSWDCCLKYLTKVKCDYFVSLPHVYFDMESKNSKRGANHLIKLLKQLNNKTNGDKRK